MALKIEKGIPIPVNGSEMLDALKSMEIGDSVLLNGKTAKYVQQRLKEVRPKKFVTRKEADGRRVWRTA